MEFFLKETLPHLRKVTRTPVIVNIDGDSAEEYGKLAELLDVDGVDAIELNISCPNVAQGGLAFGTDGTVKVVQAARAHTHKPVITKLLDITGCHRVHSGWGYGNVVGGLSGCGDLRLWPRPGPTWPSRSASASIEFILAGDENGQQISFGIQHGRKWRKEPGRTAGAGPAPESLRRQHGRKRQTDHGPGLSHL